MVNDRLDSVKVCFDDERSVANAGVLLVATLADRLGLERLIGECVRLGRHGARFRPGRKVLSLVFAIVLGANSIDGCNVLRTGRTRRLLGFRAMAPSTLGTFLRAFGFGHVRQLDRVLGLALGRAWRAGAGPGGERLVIDVDSFVGEVYGRLKQGASYGYTHVLGYHPLLATRAASGEVLHIRFRTGAANTQRGIIRFCDEPIARVRASGATGQILLRADSGFHNKDLRQRLDGKGVLYSIGARVTKRVHAAISEIDEDAWQPLSDYPITGEAQIAESTLGGERLIVRRVRPLDKRQQPLLETWQHHALLTNRTDALALVEAEHRAHAVVELAIRDVKDQALAHFPSGQFAANAAWTPIACLAHNMLRPTELAGLPDSTPRRARTHRRRLLQLPGRLTRHARTTTLHLPSDWRWKRDWTTALEQIRALPALT